MTELIRVAIIDDHPLFREGVVTVLMGEEGIEVVREGATAADALRIAQEVLPDVMLLDIGVPGGGVEAAASIARACPDVRTVMLTASENEQHVMSALQAGARGYILKGSSGQEVVEAVRAIAKGDSYMAPNLAARLLINRGKQVETVKDSTRSLNSREEEVFAFVVRGRSSQTYLKF